MEMGFDLNVCVCTAVWVCSGFVMHRIVCGTQEKKQKKKEWFSSYTTGEQTLQFEYVVSKPNSK